MRSACFFNSNNLEAACKDLKKASEMGYEPAKEDYSTHCYDKK